MHITFSRHFLHGRSELNVISEAAVLIGKTDVGFKSVGFICRVGPVLSFKYRPLKATEKKITSGV